MSGAALLMVQGALMMLLPVVVILLVRRRTPLLWGPLLVGAAAFFGIQLVKTPFNLGIVALTKNGTLALSGWLTIVLFALVPGVWEEITKWGPMKLLKVKDWTGVISFGLGFGGIEAMLLGLNTLVLGAMAGTGAALPPEVAEQIAASSAGATALGGVVAVVERASAMGAHLGFTFLNAQALRPGKGIRWMVYAMVAHTVMDIFAAAWQLRLPRTTATTLLIEGFILLWALGSLWYVRRCLQEGPLLPEENAEQVAKSV